MRHLPLQVNKPFPFPMAGEAAGKTTGKEEQRHKMSLFFFACFSYPKYSCISAFFSASN